MMLSTRGFLLGLALCCFAACAPQPASDASAAAADGSQGAAIAEASPPSKPAAQGDSLLTSCQADTDCAVKDVGSCCGYRPACVNQDARTDPSAVQARCAQEGRVGICGFQEIESCKCVSGTCKASPAGNGPAAPVRLQ